MHSSLHQTLRLARPSLIRAALLFGGPLVAFSAHAADEDESTAVAQDDDSEDDDAESGAKKMKTLRPLRPGQVAPGPTNPVPSDGPRATTNWRAKAGNLTPEERAEAQVKADAEAEAIREAAEERASSSSRRASSSEATDDAVESGARQRPPIVDKNAQVSIDFVDAPLTDVVKFMAEITGRNFILTDDLKGEITIISHEKVSVAEAYEAFLSAMEQAGYTTVTVGKATKVVSTSDAASTPLRVYEGGNIPYTDNYVTQIVQLDNVSVTDVSSIVKDLAGKGAKVIAYAPTNTLIITDAASNIRRIYRIISQLDVAAPRSKMQIIPVRHATADELAKVIKELYGGETTTSSKSSKDDSASSRRSSSRRNRKAKAEAASSAATATSVGAEGKYIEKIISDERTNSLIVIANEEAMAAVMELIAELDVDVDPSSRAKIHVIYLEHAKAEDISKVLSDLASGGSSSSSSSSSSRSRSSRSRNSRNTRGGAPEASDRRGGPFGSTASSGSDADGESGGAVAAFDSGVRITSDENTNSLVIIATPDQLAIIRQVIDQLDIRRKQVFVEAVVLEVASEDTNEFGIGVHVGSTTSDGGFSIGSAQLNGSSLGISSDVLSGMAMGVYGPSFDVPVTGADGSATTMSVPAFGIALNALQANSSVNILSTPNVLTMDNEEAKIVVGRNIPFPVSTGRDNNGQAIVSYQREDVAITLKVTPQINESNYVTLEVFQEVQEIEEDSQGLDVTSAGFITSKRSVENTVVVKDNQTIVIGGLIGETETEVETKIPILGDIPLIGRLFRGQRQVSRKSNMLIFLTPHIIDEPSDLEEVYRVKWAQRQEFIRRFYGKSRDEQDQALQSLLSYSMNQIDQPSRYRGPALEQPGFKVIGEEDMADPAMTTVRPSDAPVSDPAADKLDDLDETTLPEKGE